MNLLFECEFLSHAIYYPAAGFNAITNTKRKKEKKRSQEFERLFFKINTTFFTGTVRLRSETKAAAQNCGLLPPGAQQVNPNPLRRGTVPSVIRKALTPPSVPTVKLNNRERTVRRFGVNTQLR